MQGIGDPLVTGVMEGLSNPTGDRVATQRLANTGHSPPLLNWRDKWRRWNECSLEERIQKLEPQRSFTSTGDLPKPGQAREREETHWL